ncbi:AraC family transcriptional regulator [Vallitaleaceae bacterium 9-2]
MYTLSHLISNNKLDLGALYEIMKSAHYSFGISISLFNQQKKQLKTYGTGHELFAQYSDIYTEYMTYMDQNLPLSTTPILFKSSYGVHYLSFPLIHNNNFYGFIALGPFLESTLSEHQLNQIIQSKDLALSERHRFKGIFSKIPTLSKTHLFHIEKTFITLLESNHSPKTSTVKPDSENTDQARMTPMLDTHSKDTLSNFLNFDFELLFLDKVGNGDVEQVFALYYEHLRPAFSDYSTTGFIDNQFNAIILNTLLSRKVIQSSVDADYAIELSHQFIEAIKSSKTSQELMTVVEDMISKYTNSVLHIDSINHVGVIKKASKYVHNHLSEAIRLQEVADYIGLSPNYFSSLFKKEMNLAFADYVNHIRIKESQYLLKTTDQSILDIALAVGFNNQNYFTTIFKKVTGITPKQYRIKT